MAGNPKINLALVNENPSENLVKGTVYMSPDTSVSVGFIKIATAADKIVTIFDASEYATKQQVIDNEYAVATAINDLSTRIDDVSAMMDDIDLLTEVTYTDLKTLRDTSALKPGMRYLITDYTCTTTQTDTSSAGNVFDIIVTADSEAVLNENAHAVLHEGDTYFQACDLDAWELKYCLDNDTDRFMWADATNGKGVIYYMKDEWSNECPYDFKNIMFTDSDTNYYTFDILDDSVHNDFSVAQTSMSCYGNIIGENSNDTGGAALHKLTLGRNIFKNTSLSSICCSNTLKNDCYNNTFENGCRNNTFGNYCHHNSFGNGCMNNTFGNECYTISFGFYCSKNAFGNYCSACSFGSNCTSNTFGNYCYNNVFGNYCQAITVFDNVKFCNITGGASSSPVQNAQILNGTHGASSNNKQIITFSHNKYYTQVAGLVDGTDLRIWIAEDTVTGPTSSAVGNVAIFDGSSGKIIKDSGLKISDIGATTETTWYMLKLLKENSELVPGWTYRITDYNTTVSEDLTDVSVAEHQFDVIVTALSETELDCHASAIQHAGDTYFSDCDLSKWQLWYDIENDTEKYAWAVGDSSSANSGAKGSIPTYAPEYLTVSRAATATLGNAGLSIYLVFQGIETIDTGKDTIECYMYGTPAQATALGCTKIFCQEYPSTNSEIYGISDNKGDLVVVSTVNSVSNSTQPTDGTKIIANSVTGDTIAVNLEHAGLSPVLKFNGRIVMYKGQKCYSYGSADQYTALSTVSNTVTDIIVEDGVAPVAPTKAPSRPGTYVIVLDSGMADTITAVSQATVVVGGTGGTGVIYRMIDEWGNDCPYDFKNILFKRKLTNGALDDQGTDIWCYTFNGYNSTESEYYDISSHPFYISEQTRQDAIDDGDGADECDMCYNNVILPAKYADNLTYKDIKTILNNIVFLGKSFDSGLSGGYDVAYCFSNTFGNDCYNSTFGKNFFSNTFGNDCHDNTFGEYCHNNIFGNNCYSNSFGNSCYSNLFGSECYRNEFLNGCSHNLFLNYCRDNRFDGGCSHNSFGNGCYYSTFHSNFTNNSLGNDCENNSFGTYFQNNSIGNSCNSNTFGNICQNNSFGNSCNSNTFGNYCQAITIFDNVKFCNITGGTSSSPVQNAQILNGTKGTSASNKLTITFTANQSYTQIAGLNSSGVLKIWTPADLID